MSYIIRTIAISSLILIASAPSTASAAIADGTKKTCQKSLALIWTCLPTHADTNGTYRVNTPEDSPSYKSIQWIGDARQCTKPSYQSCSIEFTQTRTNTVSWKVGISGEYSAGVKDVSSWKATLSGELSGTRTDSDMAKETLTVKGGYTIVQYSYVPRQWYKSSYFGAWVRGSSHYGCGFLKLSRCYDYYWDNDYYVVGVRYKRALESFQTVTNKTYPNGTASGLTLEND